MYPEVEADIRSWGKVPRPTCRSVSESSGAGNQECIIFTIIIITIGFRTLGGPKENEKCLNRVFSPFDPCTATLEFHYPAHILPIYFDF